MLIALIVAIVLLVLVGLSNIALQRRTGQLEAEVQNLRAGQDISERISYLVHNGRVPEAVIAYRKATGMGVAESKRAVDIIARNNPQL